MKRHTIATTLFALGLAFAGPHALAADDHGNHGNHGNHGDHGDHGDHRHHHHQGHAEHAAADEAPWAYAGRDNPEPHAAEDRWEMIQVPHMPQMFVQAGSVDVDNRCAALLENPRFMVDRTTRARCGESAPRRERDSEPSGHDGHQH